MIRLLLLFYLLFGDLIIITTFVVYLYLICIYFDQYYHVPLSLISKTLLPFFTAELLNLIQLVNA